MRRAVAAFSFLLISTSLFAAEALRIVSAGPVGETATLAEANEIRVVFSEPMVVLGRIPQPVTAPFFRIDPAVKGTDYAFWKTIYDEFPAEVQELYRLYTAASPSGQALLNLQLVQAFGSAPPATPLPAAKIPD